jgi:hypothetical protein
MIPKFNKYDAISMHDTTPAQRRHLHELYEKLGGQVVLSSVLRNQRTDDYAYHLYLCASPASNLQLGGVSTSAKFIHKLKFHPYSWWIDKLYGKKYFDNTAESPTNTHLDKQIEFLNITL